MLEVKARMIVPESETKGWAEELLEPLARLVKGLALSVQKHPFIAILVLLALLFLVWRLHKQHLPLIAYLLPLGFRCRSTISKGWRRTHLMNLCISGWQRTASGVPYSPASSLRLKRE